MHAVDTSRQPIRRAGAAALARRPARLDSIAAPRIGSLVVLLGYRHSWGINNNGVDWNPAPPFEASDVYGDPYDIMSSGSFGSRWDPARPRWSANPTFMRNDLATAVPGWPNAGAWAVMGPRLALAQLRHHDLDALGGRARVLVRAPAGWSGSFTLQSAGLPAEHGGTRLLVLRPPGSSSTGPDPDGTLYVEYRGLDGWDRGLETAGDDLARRAVVVHERASDGAQARVIWYCGRVAVPAEVDRDIRPATSDLVVTLTGVADDLRSVTVSLSTDPTRRVIVDRNYSVVQTTIVASETHEIRFLCGTRTYELRSLLVEVAGTFRASAFGYGGTGLPDTSRPPRLAWTVGGVALPAAAGAVVVPTAAGDRTVTIDYAVDAVAGTLVLRNRPADDAYEVAVVATVSEVDGSQQRAAAPVQFVVDGQVSRYEDDYYRDMLRCEQRITARLNIKRRWWLPDPDPIRDLVIPPRPPVDRLEALSDVIRKERPDVAAELVDMIETRKRTDTLATGLREKIRRDPKLLRPALLEQATSIEARTLGKKLLPTIKKP